MRTTKMATTALVVAAAVLGTADAASANTPDLQIVSITPSVTSVPVGVPTQVTFTLNVRNVGDETTGPNTAIGPVGGAPTFTTVRMGSPAPATCDAPAGDAPRCHAPFFQRPFTQVVEVTDTVVASSLGTVTRTFAASVQAPDTEGNPSDNQASATLAVVPDDPIAVRRVTVRSAASLTARQRGRAVGRLRFTLNRAATVTVTIERNGPTGHYGPWGSFTRRGRAGVNSWLLPTRVDLVSRIPVSATIDPMRPGTYRLTVVATDADGRTSSPVRRRLVIGR